MTLLVSLFFAPQINARPRPFQFPPAIDQSPTAMLAVDPETGDFLASNQAAQRLYGWSGAEFRALSLSDMSQVPQKVVLERLELAAKLRQNYFHTEHRFKDGSLHSVSLFSWPVTQDNENALMTAILETDKASTRTNDSLVANFSDAAHLRASSLERTYGRLNLAFTLALAVLAMTVILLIVIIIRRRHLVRELAHQHLLLRVVMDSIPDQIYFKSPDRKIVACNQAAAEFVGLPADMIVGKTDDQIFGRNEDEFLRQQVFRDVGDSERRVAQGEVTGPNGEKHTLEIFKAAVISSKGKRLGSVSVWRDITERRHNEERIEALAFYDPLTKLANRVKAQDVMLDVLKTHAFNKQFLALAVFDLDNFAALNSIFGHSIGDALLRTIGRRLKHDSGADSFAARLSSDEFLVLLTGLGPDRTEAWERAQDRIARLHSKLSRKAFVNSHHITPSTCVGAVLVGPDTESANDELRRADMAMHNAKAKGRGSISWFHEEMADELVSRFDMENALEQALQNGGFRLYLQPIIKRKAAGRHFEVLLRLEHPERGIVSPGDFIDVAESTGLIVPIGAWVLEEACKLLSEYPDLHLSVNVSVQQFLQEDFVDYLSGFLKRYDFEPENLTLEMTESLMIANFELTLAQLLEIRNLKVRLSIDDFGTGYSALLYLKQLPLDELKIDQSFISGVPHDSNDTSLVELIITTAHHLGLVIVAEGVETHEQEKWLRQYGCESLQGYLFSRPQPVESYLPSSH